MRRRTRHAGGTIRRRDADAIYWLQDYYPELVRGLHEYPVPLRRVFRRFWDSKLAQWDRVVKIGENLGGPCENAIVIRNWPTIDFDRGDSFEPGIGLYLGNFGYGHDLGHLIDACERLRDGGYTISIRADGPGRRAIADLAQGSTSLPRLEESEPSCYSTKNTYRGASKNHPGDFPFQIWNSLAAKRELICTGFVGVMADELEASKQAPFERHLQQWLESFAARNRSASGHLGLGRVGIGQRLREVITYFDRADLAHAPVGLVAATPLHLGLERAAAIDKAAEVPIGLKLFRNRGAEEDRSRFSETVREMRRARVVGDDGAGVRDEANQLRDFELIYPRHDVRPRQNGLERGDFLRQDLAPQTAGDKTRLRKAIDQGQEIGQGPVAPVTGRR